MTTELPTSGEMKQRIDRLKEKVEALGGFL